MSQRKYRFVALLLTILILLTKPIQASAVSHEDTLPSGIPKDTIGSEIESFVAEHKDTTAGMAVSVFDQSSVIYHNYFGYSDIENMVTVDQDTVFEWGSITKLLVWVSAMQLWEKGMLELDADIRQYLPEGFLQNLNYDTPVTMLNLMNHNAGFENTALGMFTHREEEICSLEEYLTNVQPQQVFAPGEVTAYSNWGVALAGFVVEQISGVPFYDYVQENIFAPLGMEHSALNADLSDNPWVKQQWEKLKCYTTDAELIPERMKYINAYPAGMCTSTIEDFETFARALLNRESALFQNPATYDTFMSPSAYFGDTDIPLIYHGLWEGGSYGVSVIGHGGSTYGCSSYLLLDLQNRVGMVVMTNQYGEIDYNCEMPELLFGKYEGDTLDFGGYVVFPRCIFRGPLKLEQLLNTFNVSPENLNGRIFVLSGENGVQKITAPSGDYLVTSMPKLIVQYLPLIFWLLGLLFCLLNLIIRCIGWIVRKLRHRDSKRPAKKWAIVACALQLLSLIPVVFAVPSMFGWIMWPIWQYKAVFGAFLVWAAVYAWLAVFGIRKMAGQKNADVYSVAVILSLVISIVNIFYWELGAFWLL